MNDYQDWVKAIWSMISGAFMTMIGYFVPIKDIFLLLVLFFIIDVIFGYLKAKKLRGEKFSQKIVWKTTVPRMLISLVLIICAYMWDDVYNQNTIPTYHLIGWCLSGLLLGSIAINGYHITKWDIFLGIGKYFQQRSGEHGIKATTEETEQPTEARQI